MRLLVIFKGERFYEWERVGASRYRFRGGFLSALVFREAGSSPAWGVEVWHLFDRFGEKSTDAAPLWRAEGFATLARAKRAALGWMAGARRPGAA